MVKNTVLILIMLTIAAIIVLDLVVVLNVRTEKPQVIAEFTENFTIPYPSNGSHYGYREAAQDKIPSLSDYLTAALNHMEG